MACSPLILPARTVSYHTMNCASLGLCLTKPSGQQPVAFFYKQECQLKADAMWEALMLCGTDSWLGWFVEHLSPQRDSHIMCTGTSNLLPVRPAHYGVGDEIKNGAKCAGCEDCEDPGAGPPNGGHNSQAQCVRCGCKNWCAGPP